MIKWLLCKLVRGYQIFLSPVLHFLAGPLAGCRFQPTCSQYFIDAVQTHGSLRGTWLGLRRILRCNPWGGQGYDPVPGCEQDKQGAALQSVDSKSDCDAESVD